MIIFIQYPLADIRSFLNCDTGRLGSPIWPAPIPHREFVRNFGEIQQRSKGGITGWVAESELCKSRNAIRFAEQLRFETKYDPLILKCGGRHLYFDGLAVAKLEIVLIAHPLDISLYPDPISNLLERVLAREVRFPKLRKDGDVPAARLHGAGKLLAQLYLVSSTRRSELDGIDPAWVKCGEPLVLLESTPDEALGIPLDRVEVDLNADDIALQHWWLPGPRRTGIWRVDRFSDEEPTRAKGRTLRILLMRLHAEQQALQRVLKSISDGEISPASKGGANPAADGLQFYLSLAARRIFRMTKSAEQLIEPEQVAGVIRSSFDAVSPGQRDALLQKLELCNIRPQVAENLNSVIHNFYNVREVHVDKVTNIDNKGQMIYADGDAQVSHAAMSQTVQAPAIDLQKLADELERLRQDLQGRAATAQERAALEHVAEAERQARAGDQSRTLEHLKAAGKWALGFAEKVGVSLAAAVIRSSLGMGGA